ncbi:insulin-related peptide binding protein isoform X1 [Bombyx mori]|uniref:insulin-related peptide binding protein isoform X1 n=1 Tax=Bombyx mori TaxID=7091 RepID=UPI002ED2182F
MHLVLLFTVAALLGSCQSAHLNKHIKLLSDIDNSIENGVQAKSDGSHKYLSITQGPLPSYAHTPGTTIELTCEAAGSPAPSVHWFKNDSPVYEYDVESNELIDSSPTSIARISSTLIVTRTTSQDVYTCLATTSSKTARASTVVYNTVTFYSPTDSATELSERAKLFPLKPRIVVSYSTYVDNIGNRVVLPCRVKGHPKPKITWFNGQNVPIEKNPRMKVLRSGELVISSLLWSDMDEYTCQAENAFGSEKAKTFVYPAKPE